ncbi:MAG: spondin domain-containing protein [Myxococcota bacterium]
MLSLVCASSPAMTGCVIDGGDGAEGDSSGGQDETSTTGDATPADAGDETAGDETAGDETAVATDGDTDGETEGETEGDTEGVETETFRVTITNATRYLSTTVFNTPVGGKNPAPLVNVGDSYQATFYAVPGARLNFATMSAATNDWFFAPEGNGIALFDGDGNPNTGDITDQVDLWDAGTEEEDPATIATVKGGAEAGDPDDDDSVRVVMADVSGSLTADLAYEDGEFTLTLTREGEAILTPGLVMVHSADNPFFVEGDSDAGYGLELLAEAGNPMDLYNFFNEAGEDGAPLRLSSSLSPLSPGLVYTFPGGDGDPLFVQGEAAGKDSGVEELAEAGNNMVAYDFLTGAGYSAGLSENEGGVGAGGALTFTVEAEPGDNLGFATMFVQSNDWFLSFNNDGIPLWDEDGNPIDSQDVSVEAYLFDAGTEADEAIGFGPNQAPRQPDADAGEPDEDTTIRRVTEIDDVQFGKGLIESGPGVVALHDARGGYNLVTVEVERVTE